MVTYVCILVSEKVVDLVTAAGKHVAIICS